MKCRVIASRSSYSSLEAHLKKPRLSLFNTMLLDGELEQRLSLFIRTSYCLDIELRMPIDLNKKRFRPIPSNYIDYALDIPVK